MSQNTEQLNVFGAVLTRRGFVKTGGALVVGFCILKGSAEAATTKNSLDATLPESWIEIHPDNTILIRTGKSDFGQSTTFTAYRQIVAEELSAPFEAITTVVMGDTDRTPDGSGAFDFLGSGMPNIRKAAAYTYQALLDLGSQRLGVPKGQLSAKDGVLSGGGKNMSYGDLVNGQQLKLTIPVKGDLTRIMGLTVDGNPPMKPVSEYTVVGKSFRNSVTASKVAAKEQWATDVRLPGCCTHEWCIRKASARRWYPQAPWTRRSFRIRRWWSRAISWEWLRPLNGKPSAPRNRWQASRSGRIGKGCLATLACSIT